ncbi:MAG: ABC transporter ATP-binding protein [Chloroflexota bacterium]
MPDDRERGRAGLAGALAVVKGRSERAYGSVPGMLRMLVLAVLLFAVPYYINPISGEAMFDNRWLVVFRLVGLYIMLGIGLNIVVGYAGLLDLGYVAFFASGAYLYALLASPVSPAIDFPIEDYRWLFWAILPTALVVGAAIGIALGIPVLPLRGDYLAIVTLGFGEIIRLFLINKADWTGGSQGLSRIEPPPLPAPIGDLTVGAHKEWYMFVVICIFVVAFIAGRLRDSRIGRAWEAIREDEEVAGAMGVNTVKYKLLAFAMGAAIGSFGGAVSAGFTGSALPDSFDLLVSINVLSLVVIGGMGSTPGVCLGALILIGIPEFLRFREASDLLGYLDPLVPFANTQDWAEQIRDNRFVVFGALLVAVMVFRPTGLVPSRRRKLEFESPGEEAPAAAV